MWWLMLRLLGAISLVVLCVDTAPWGLLVGAALFAGWLLLKPVPLSKTHGLRSPDEQLRVSDSGSRLLSAIPLLNAVYCANCDLITNSPHDACGVCGSRSVIAVSRMWQLTPAEAPTNAARYKVSFTADICEIPANGLQETTRLISRLAELGGEVKALHTKVDPVFSSYSIPSDPKITVLKPVGQASIGAQQQIHRQAS